MIFILFRLVKSRFTRFCPSEVGLLKNAGREQESEEEMWLWWASSLSGWDFSSSIIINHSFAFSPFVWKTTGWEWFLVSQCWGLGVALLALATEWCPHSEKYFFYLPYRYIWSRFLGLLSFVTHYRCNFTCFIFLLPWEINECIDLGSNTLDICFCYSAAPHLYDTKKKMCDTKIPFRETSLSVAPVFSLGKSKPEVILWCTVLEKRKGLLHGYRRAHGGKAMKI